MAAGDKGLIAYYSRKGNNYMRGHIVNLTVGNTEVVAKKIQEFTGSDLFEIKTIMPFCTHEGSGMGHSESDIRRVCNDAIVRPGLAIPGSSVAVADRVIEDWINN